MYVNNESEGQILEPFPDTERLLCGEVRLEFVMFSIFDSLRAMINQG